MASPSFNGNHFPADVVSTSPGNEEAQHPSQYDAMARASISASFALSCNEQEGEETSFCVSSTPLLQFPPQVQVLTLSSLLFMIDKDDNKSDSAIFWISGWVTQASVSDPLFVVDRNAWGEIPLHYWIRSEWKNRRLYQLLRIVLDRYPDLVFCQCMLGRTVLYTMAAVWMALTKEPLSTGNATLQNINRNDDNDDNSDDCTDLIPVSHQEESSLHDDLVRSLAHSTGSSVTTPPVVLSPELRALVDLYNLLLKAACKAISWAAATTTLRQTRIPPESQVGSFCQDLETIVVAQTSPIATNQDARSTFASFRQVLASGGHNNSIPSSFFALAKRLQGEE